MKHLVILFFVAMSTMMFAQENSIGPTIGYNHAWVSGDNVKAKPGFNVGLIYNNSFLEHWGAGLSLLYSAEGAKAEVSDISTNLTYIRLPLRLQYFFGDFGQAFRPKIYVGPSLAFLVGAKLDQNGNNIDVKDGYEKFDLGLLAGLGFNYRLKDQTWLNFDLGYTHGLLDISTGSNEPKNRLINANVGVAFGF